MENPLIKELMKIVDEFLQSEKGNLNGAVHLATNFSKENSISPDSLLELAYFWASNNSYSLVYIFARTSGILSTDNAKKSTAYFIAGTVSIIMGRRDEAEEQYKLALQADPNRADTHCNYGILLLDMGRHKEAEEQYKLALQADPNNADIHYNYGVLLKQLGRCEEAEKQYKLALQADPNHVNTLKLRKSPFNYGAARGSRRTVQGSD